MRRIVYNRKSDGGVSICAPTNEIISWMGCGGMWNEYPRGFSEIQIERMIDAGVHSDTAKRYADAVQFGGCTTAEALEIIRDRDCAPYGQAIEIWDWDDIPKDRWFRGAWRRSHNGGPIYVDLELARPIQMQRIAAAIDEENKRRLRNLLAPAEHDLDRLRQRVTEARDERELRQVF